MDIKVFDEHEAVARIDRRAVLDALRKAFAGLPTGSSVQPAQTVTVFPGAAGDCIFYPAALLDRGLIGVKVSPYLPALDSPVTAYTLVLSATTGRPLLLCDSLALTAARTAATTALALSYLARESAATLAVLGAGPVAREHLRYVLDQRPWSDIRVYSPSLAAGSDSRRAAELAEFAVRACPTAQEAVTGADVVLLCTSSETPVIDVSWLGPDAVVTSVGSNGQLAHEVPPPSLNDFAVFCDYRQTAPVTAGEMILATRSGEWSADRIAGDLPELIAGRVEPPTTGRTLFRSTGLGIEDLAIAGILCPTPA